MLHILHAGCIQSTLIPTRTQDLKVSVSMLRDTLHPTAANFPCAAGTWSQNMIIKMASMLSYINCVMSIVGHCAHSASHSSPRRTVMVVSTTCHWLASWSERALLPGRSSHGTYRTMLQFAFTILYNAIAYKANTHRLEYDSLACPSNLDSTSPMFESRCQKLANGSHITGSVLLNLKVSRRGTRISWKLRAENTCMQRRAMNIDITVTDI